MAKETVQAVRKAEIAAEKMIKDAQLQKETIVAEAENKAKDLSTSLLKEVELLLAMAKTKEQVAIDLVISNVI